MKLNIISLIALGVMLGGRAASWQACNEMLCENSVGSCEPDYCYVGGWDCKHCQLRVGFKYCEELGAQISTLTCSNTFCYCPVQ